MKTSALNGGGRGLVYRGGMVFRRDSTGVLSFESVPFASGRITSSGVRYELTDHLGSVRVVTDGSGDVLEASDYSAFGAQTDVTYDIRDALGLFPGSPSGVQSDPYYRHHFSGKEDQKGFNVPYTDFGARQYSTSIRRWMVPDPMSEKYYDVSPYMYCAGDPVNRVDPDGEWDVKVHLYSKRSEYGKGIAIVTNKSGKEVYRFIVRAQGVNGGNRYNIGADTPLGVYTIPRNKPWIEGGSRASYGPHPRLNMEGESGEIVDTGRSQIRIHGGRQEISNGKEWIPLDNPTLKKTYGCLRAYDDDMASFKSVTDALTESDPTDSPGTVVVVDDLTKYYKPISDNNSVEVTPVYEEPNKVLTIKSFINL